MNSGTNKFQVFIDPDGAVPELDESNNGASLNFFISVERQQRICSRLRTRLSRCEPTDVVFSAHPISPRLCATF